MPINARASSDNTVVVQFTKPLQAIGGVRPLGFELCGGLPRRCRYADASVRGNEVRIAWADNEPITDIRYAWADYPIVNLYDLDMLPVPVFDLPISVVVTGGLH
jgi:sialate O-acetylesterase